MKLSLFLVSSSVIAYQLLLLHNLSITQWYHFASMIISVALLGFGASGTFITLFRKKLMKQISFYYYLFIVTSGLFMIVSFRLTQTNFFAFDSYLIFSSWPDMMKLLWTYLLFFIPFFFAACAIGLIFSSQADRIGNLYFINLTGSAVGGLIILILLNYLRPQNALGAICFLPVIAAWFAYKQIVRFRLFSRLLLFLALALTILNLFVPSQLYLSEYKSISKILNMPESKIVREESSPHGLLQVVQSPYIRYAPGLSLNFTGKSGIEKVIFNNGNWIGPELNPLEKTEFYSYSTLSLPFVMGDPQTVLSLEAGTGEAVQLSLQNDVDFITAVESNGAVVDLLSRQKDKDHPPILAVPHVRAVKQDPYAYLLSTREQYDLIHLPLYDAFGGASGIGAVQEKPLLSIESFQRMWDNLSEHGMITISAWVDTPLKLPLRIVATFTELLEKQGIDKPEKHLAAVRNWSLATYVLSKNPIGTEKQNKVKEFSNDLGFDILLLPEIEDKKREKYHLLADKSIIELTDLIVGISPHHKYASRQDLYDNYQFKIRPVTEGTPFPFQFLKLSRLNELREQFTLFEIPYLEVGYFLVLTTFILVVLLAAVFIILPLFFARKMQSAKTYTFIYFLSLGLGFLMVEIMLIQRFIAYLGSPLYSSAIIISAILFFSGLGSNTSERITADKNRIHAKKMLMAPRNVIFVMIVLLIILYALLLNPLLLATVSLPLIIKFMLSIIIIAPLAFLMGFPFPLGISSLHQTGNSDNISWAWGINGSFSVISSVLAIIIAVEFGFTSVKLIAAGCYLLALFSSLIIKE